MSKVTATLKFLARVAEKVGAGEHSYVVGGAIRNHLMGLQPKDQDLVIDSVALGPHRDSAWFAKQILAEIPCPCSLVTNQYGVAILTATKSWILDGHEMQGEVLEIANARRESYGKGGKGYKPDAVEAAGILEDLQRRDFTCNTLLWRLSDLLAGPDSAPVLDLTGQGLADLEARLLRTPCDPDRTFTDDPTRMLRAVKFMAKYGLELHPETADSIVKNAAALLGMPWDAVMKILVKDVLLGPNPRDSVLQLIQLGLNPPLVQLLREEPGFFAGVSRGLSGADPLLLLDLWDLGWRLKGSPGTLVAEQDVTQLRAVLEGDPAGAERFMQALTRPPINQEALFERLGLVGRARAQVQRKAREALLRAPLLALDPAALHSKVEDLLRS